MILDKKKYMKYASRKNKNILISIKSKRNSKEYITSNFNFISYVSNLFIIIGNKQKSKYYIYISISVSSSTKENSLIYSR